MELKEFLKVLVKYRMTFATVWLLIVVLGLSIIFFIPQKYKATFSIDITRDNQEQIVTEYEYDQFYRLEADDRFGRTIVQWFNDEAIISQMYAVSKNVDEEFNDHKFETNFRAEKLANSYIKVTFSVSDKNEIGPIFLGVKNVLKSKTAEFNGGFRKQNRFSLIFNGPTIKEAETPFTQLLIGLFGGGFFLAIFGVMIRKYLE